MAIELIATGRAIPSRRVTNEDLAKEMDTSDEWIRSHTGIGSRHYVDPGVAASDLACEAGRKALQQALEQGSTGAQTLEELAETLDIIVVATCTPDYIGIPSTACIVQHRLGAANAGALDLVAGCSGFVYALDTAASLLLASEKRSRALVIGAEALSYFINKDDRGSYVLFGDGAGAVLIEKTAAPSLGEGKRGLLQSYLRSDGSGEEAILMRYGGSRNPYNPDNPATYRPYFEMDGRAVYNFAIPAMELVIQALLQEGEIGLEDLAWLIPHQANARIMHSAAKRFGIPEEKFYINIEEYANTSAASIPIALDEMNRNGLVRRGDYIITIGFGAGLTYGGNLFVW